MTGKNRPPHSVPRDDRSVTDREQVEPPGTAARTDVDPARSSDICDDASLRDRIATLAHELRTPLGAVLNFADLLAEERFGPLGHPKYAEYAEAIRSGANHALQVLAVSLDHAMANEVSPAIAAPVDIGPLIDACANWVAPQAAAANLTIGRPAAHQSLRLESHEVVLRQILLNLLTNAIKFTPDGGHVAIGIQPAPEGTMELTVADTGIGMTARELAVLMQGAESPPHGNTAKQLAPSRDQVEPTTPVRHASTPGTVSGIGLIQVRAQARACGAAFTLHSQRGRGTTATLTFPPERILRS